jgi:hypothetical protein
LVALAQSVRLGAVDAVQVLCRLVFCEIEPPTLNVPQFPCPSAGLPETVMITAPDARLPATIRRRRGEASSGAELWACRVIRETQSKHCSSEQQCNTYS